MTSNVGLELVGRQTDTRICHQVGEEWSKILEGRRHRMMMADVDGGSDGRGRDTAECAGVDPTEEEREESARSEVRRHRCRNWYSSGRAA